MSARTHTKPARPTNQSTRKEIARSFLSLVSSGRVGEAYEGYVSANFLHHNPYFKGNVNHSEKAWKRMTRSSLGGFRYSARS
jgi:hypothetical protein